MISSLHKSFLWKRGGVRPKFTCLNYFLFQKSRFQINVADCSIQSAQGRPVG
ncbi:RGD1562026 (predicted) [Rattus norvegicus]|uniref:RGD1562026 (Predicted) n=1 Tax=Rattus norvegicus TaxID=10116 RepID=A6IEJ8_RAT|nr:RGD1562026 (predicted) [Rattus norvegicus]